MVVNDLHVVRVAAGSAEAVFRNDTTAISEFAGHAARPPSPRIAAKRAPETARRAATEPSAPEIEARKAVAHTFFNAASAAAARAGFLKRQQADAGHSGEPPPPQGR